MNPHKKELVHNFFRAFLPALSYGHQYTTSHQLAASAINTAFTHLVEAIGTDPVLPFLFVDNKIVVNKEPMEDSVYSNHFIRFFQDRGIHHLHFQQGITREELTSFIETLTATHAPSSDNGMFPHIRFGSVGLKLIEDDGKDGDNNDTTDQEDINTIDDRSLELANLFESIHKQDLDLLMDVYDAVRKNRNLPDHEISRVVTDIITAIRQGSSMLITFSPLRVLDEYSFTHSTNVCILTLAQAMALKIRDNMLNVIGVAAMLHDIGKIFVPVDVLNKKEQLTNSEWELIRKHPQKGAEYLVDKPGIPALAPVVSYEHHMLYDFSGYPKAPKTWRQNICSQMTTISDYFDALRSKRVYRDSMEMKTITRQMADMAGKALNPFLTENFLLLLNKFIQGMDAETNEKP